MRENFTSGTVRGVPGNRHSYRGGFAICLITEHLKGIRRSANISLERGVRKFAPLKAAIILDFYCKSQIIWKAHIHSL